MTDSIESVESFAARADIWLRENMPPDAGEQTGPEPDLERARELQRRLFEGGFAGIRYPKEYGGAGLTVEHQRAFLRLAGDYELPRPFRVTHGILGPTLLDFGSEEQKARHIPAMLKGEELWVQFLSEPSGGSDMAGVITRAVRDGDTFVITGAKTWSTGAHYSDFAMALCRTDWDAPKHRGLSMILMPIRSEGVTVNPIELATGGTDFCDEFFDEVVLPTANLIGEESDGWTVASRLLFHERNMVGGSSYDDQPLAEGGSKEDVVIAVAQEAGLAGDARARQLVGEAVLLSMLGQPTSHRVVEGMRSGQIPGPGASMLKLLAALTEYRRQEIAAELAGAGAVVWDETDARSDAGRAWLTARSTTVAGGTNEMQRNQISERVLGLPREPGPDKNLPFRELQQNARQMVRAASNG